MKDRNATSPPCVNRLHRGDKIRFSCKGQRYKLFPQRFPFHFLIRITPCWLIDLFDNLDDLKRRFHERIAFKYAQWAWVSLDEVNLGRNPKQMSASDPFYWVINFHNFKNFHNFNQFSQFQLIFTISTDLHNSNRCSQLQSIFTISTKFSQFQPIFTIWTTFWNFGKIMKFGRIDKIGKFGKSLVRVIFGPS